MIHVITALAVEASQGFTSADQDQRALTAPTARIGYALGPQALRLPQEWPYDQRWAAWPNIAGVMLKKVPEPTLIWTPDETGTQTSLFSAAIFTNHLTLAFDQNSSEVIAWQNGPRVEVRRIFNGALQIDSWIGFAPLATFNGLFNTDVPTGDTDVVIYYLRAGRNSIFARIQRDNYGVEYVAANVPFQPIDLARSWFTAGTRIHRIEAVDSGWRSCILATDPYPVPAPPPSPPTWQLAAMGDSGMFDHSLSGIHYPGTITSTQGDAGALTSQLTGEHAQTAMTSNQGDAGELFEAISGEYALTVVGISHSADVGAFDSAVTGAEELQSIVTGFTEPADLTSEVTGTYS